MRSVVFIVVLLLGFCGCASTRVTNVTEGRDLPVGADAETARKASTLIQVTDAPPSGAVIIGPVEAGRGHRDWRNEKPTQSDVINDLKIAAYARGADGISLVKFESHTGLTDNYWWVLQGKAIAWRKAVAP
jgi:hypothetical protein